MKFEFREATSTSVPVNIVKTLLQSSMLWAIFIFIIPHFLLKYLPEWHFTASYSFRQIGLVMAIASGIGNLYSGIYLAYHGEGTPLPVDTARKFVDHGPFRLVRNPIATFGILTGSFLGLYWNSVWVTIYSLLGAFLWTVLVRPMEEKDLEERFGADYSTYKAKVGLWLPFLNLKF